MPCLALLDWHVMATPGFRAIHRPTEVPKFSGCLAMGSPRATGQRGKRGPRMANDIQDRIGQIMGSDTARELAGTAVSEALKALGQRSNGSGSGNGNGHRGLSGVRGLAAGAGAAAVAPVAAKGIGKLIRGNAISEAASAPKKLAEGAASKLGDNVGDKVTGKIDEAGGPSGILKDTVKSALPFGGGGGGG